MVGVVLQVCERALFSLRMLQQTQQSSAMDPLSLTSFDHTGHSIAMEEAKLHWKQGDKTYAMALMNKLLDTLKVTYMGRAYVSGNIKFHCKPY